MNEKRKNANWALYGNVGVGIKLWRAVEEKKIARIKISNPRENVHFFLPCTYSGPANVSHDVLDPMMTVQVPGWSKLVTANMKCTLDSSPRREKTLVIGYFSNIFKRFPYRALTRCPESTCGRLLLKFRVWSRKKRFTFFFWERKSFVLNILWMQKDFSTSIFTGFDFILLWWGIFWVNFHPVIMRSWRSKLLKDCVDKYRQNLYYLIIKLIF